METISLALVMDLSDDAEEGAGWYIQVSIDGHMLMTPMPVSVDTAHTLSQEIYGAMQASPHEMPNFSPMQVVQSGSGQIKQTLEAQLEYARTQARKVQILEARLGSQQERNNGQQQEFRPPQA